MTRLIPALLLSIVTVSLAQAPAKLPDGHPPMTAPGATMQLPAGHPAINKPASMPAKAKGRLTIKVVAKTKDATVPMNAPVAVHFYTQDKETGHVDTHLDARGMAVVEGFDLTPASTQALAIVDYSGVTYQGPSGVMNSASTEGKIELNVYMTTTEMPDWRVSMRHVMLEQQEQGLRIVEMLAINNPSDKTWVAKHDGDSRHATAVIRLPEDAQNIEFGDGFSSASSGRIENQSLYYLEPIVPGPMRLQFGYTLPVKDGKARLPIVAPAITKQLIVFVPDDGTQVQPSGLALGESMGKGMRMYQTKAMDAGSSASLTFLGLKQTAAMTKGSLSTGQIVLASAVGLVLVIGTAVMLMKPAKAKQKQG